MALGALEKRTFLALQALEDRAVMQEQQAGALEAQDSSCDQESNGAGCAAAPPAGAPSENDGLLGADLDASFGASDESAPVAASKTSPVGSWPAGSPLGVALTIEKVMPSCCTSFCRLGITLAGPFVSGSSVSSTSSARMTTIVVGAAVEK